MSITIGIADDHELFSQSISLLINSFSEMQITLQAIDGVDMLKKLAALTTRPQILLIDINMPVMNGLKTVEHITKDYPDIKTVALSMKEDEEALIRMLAAGCSGWWLKDLHPDEWERAIRQVAVNGYYNADVYNIAYRAVTSRPDEQTPIVVNHAERQFLQAICNGLTLEELAIDLNLSADQFDQCRDGLYDKFHVRTRVGLVMEAIRKQLVRRGDQSRF